MNRRHRTTLATDATEIHAGDILAFKAAGAAGHADAAARRFRKDDETERQES